MSKKAWEGETGGVQRQTSKHLCLNIWPITAGRSWLHLWWASCISGSTRWSVSSASARSRCTDTCVRRCRWRCPHPGRSRWCTRRFSQQRAALSQWDWGRREGWEGNSGRSLEEERGKEMRVLKHGSCRYMCTDTSCSCSWSEKNVTGSDIMLFLHTLFLILYLSVLWSMIYVCLSFLNMSFLWTWQK